MPERFADRMRRQRMETIVHATAELLAENGAAELRVEEVARRSGVAKGTIYLDFGSKEELVERALRTCRDEILDLLADRVGEIDQPYARLNRAVACLADLPSERPHLGAVLGCRGPGGLGGPWPCPDIEAFIGDLVRQAQEAGEVRTDVLPPLAAQVALTVTYLPAWRELVSEHGSQIAADRFLRSISG